MAGVDSVDDFGVVDALEVDRGDAEVAVAQLALDGDRCLLIGIAWRPLARCADPPRGVVSPHDTNKRRIMCDNSGTSAPLAGLRVVDFGQYIAGPAVAMLLADQGARVLRVDPPEGPRWDQPANAILNRGKASIALNLKLAPDRAIARRLVDSADVVVENFRPGVMQRLGLGREEIRRQPAARLPLVARLLVRRS